MLFHDSIVVFGHRGKKDFVLSNVCFGIHVLFHFLHQEQMSKPLKIIKAVMI